MKKLNSLHALSSEITVEIKRWQDSESSPLVASIDRDIIMQKLRILYQMTSEIEVMSSDDLLDLMDEDLMPEVEVEFDYEDDSEEDDLYDSENNRAYEQSNNTKTGTQHCESYSTLESLLHKNNTAQHRDVANENAEKSSLRDKLEHSRSNIPCPHHITNNTPLSHLVNTITDEYECEESKQNLLNKKEKEDAIKTEKTIELIVSEMNEPQELKEESVIEEWGPKSNNHAQGGLNSDNKAQEDSGADNHSIVGNPAILANITYGSIGSDPAHDMESNDSSMYGSQVILFGQSISQSHQQRIIDELFDADERKFEEQVSLLEKMESLDDVLIHIGQNYSWRGDNPSATEFIELLEIYFEPKE